MQTSDTGKECWCNQWMANVTVKKVDYMIQCVPRPMLPFGQGEWPVRQEGRDDIDG